jgi:hypothetical protein
MSLLRQACHTLLGFPHKKRVCLIWAACIALLGVQFYHRMALPDTPDPLAMLRISGARQVEPVFPTLPMQAWQRQALEKSPSDASAVKSESDTPLLTDAATMGNLLVRVGAVFLEGTEQEAAVALIEAQDTRDRDIRYERIRIGDTLGNFTLIAMSTTVLTFEVQPTSSTMERPLQRVDVAVFKPDEQSLPR